MYLRGDLKLIIKIDLDRDYKIHFFGKLPQNI